MFAVAMKTLAHWNASRLASGITVLVSCLVVFSAGQSGAQEAKAGWVLDQNGQWAVSGSTTLLAQAASVPAGGQLVNLAPKDGDYIRIADLHGELLRSLRCSKNGCGQCVKNEDDCTAPIEPLPKAPAHPGLIAVTWEGLMDLFGGQPERYSIHRSRSIGAETCISEDVVPLDASGNAHLDGLLKNCVPGDYKLEFAPAGAAAADHEVQDARQQTVTWKPSEPASIAPVALAAGLYRVRYTREFRTGGVWILVCASPSFENDRVAFEKLSAVVDGWGQQVETNSKVAYKRAYLDYLSRSKGGPDQVR